MERILNLFNSKCSSITFAHKWSISNYSRLYDEGHPWKWDIFPDTFSPPNNEKFECRLFLYPKSKVEDKKDYVSIGFGVYEMPKMCEGKIRSQWKVSIEDKNGAKCKTFDMGVYTLINNQGKYVTNYLKYSDILNCASQYLPGDKLTLHFEIHLQADDRIFNVITNNEVGRSRFDCANKVNRVEHTWTIENFADWFSEDSVAPHLIQSELKEPNERFSLHLFPNGTDAESSDCVEIHIWNTCETNVTIHGRMSFLDVDGEQCQTKEGTSKNNSNSGMIFRYNRASLLNSSNGLLYNGKLRIYCQMSYMIDPTDSELDNNAHTLHSVHKSESVFDVKQKAVHYVEHKWTIDKFSALCLDSPFDHSIESKMFGPPTDTQFKFQLLVSPNNYDQHRQKCLSLDVCNLSVDKVTAQSRLSILTANGDRMSKCGGQTTIPQYGGIRTSNFIPLSVLQNASLAKQFLPDDKLTIICELWVILDRKAYKTSPDTLVNKHSGSSAVLNMANANLQGVVINVQSESKIGDIEYKNIVG